MTSQGTPPSFGEYENANDPASGDEFIPRDVDKTLGGWVTVRRQRPIFTGILAKFYVLIDGKVSGALSGNSQLTFDVSTGRHVVTIRGGGRSSQSNEIELNVQPGHTYCLECANAVPFAAQGIAMLFSLGEPRKWVTLSLISDSV